MFRKYLLPFLSALGLAFGIYTVAAGAKPVPVARPAAEPAPAPFEHTIAGAGIVESRSQNVAIGTPVPGVVVEIPAHVGLQVQAGDVLFRIDDRDRRAELDVRRTALATERANLARIESLPRPEEVPAAEARMHAAQSELADTQNQLQLADSLPDKRAMAQQEWDRRRFAVQLSEARVAEARAQLDLLKAGAWKPEADVVRASVAAAEARVKAQETEVERLVVRAPIAGTVLQVNVRLGEYAPSGAVAAAGGALSQPLVMLGDVARLHVRVDIDENDAWRFRPGAPAEAFVRGNRDLAAKLEFVRVEPYVIPKRSLTGDSAERVDTRVLQVLYAFDPGALPVYVGQQMDVFIEAAPRAVPGANQSSGANETSSLPSGKGNGSSR